MPAARLSMGRIREILRLKHERGLSHRAIAQACAIGVGTVSLYLQRTAQQGLGWPLPAELDDAALEARLYPRATALRNRVRPDCAHIHRELKHNGVTLQLLWEEYAEVHPNGYGRTEFALLKHWAKGCGGSWGPPARGERSPGGVHPPELWVRCPRMPPVWRAPAAHCGDRRLRRDPAHPAPSGAADRHPRGPARAAAPDAVPSRRPRHRWGRRPDPRRHPLLNAPPRRPARPACPTCALPHRCRLWRGAFSAVHSLLTPAHSCG